MFSKTVDTIRTKFSTVILNYIEVLWKTSYDSNELFCSHFFLYEGPLCAMTSRPHGWYLRNIAKIDQETSNDELFHFFFQNCLNDSTVIFYSIFTLCGRPMCAMRLTSYGWDLRNIDQGTASCELLRFFLISRHESNKTFYSHSKLY